MREKLLWIGAELDVVSRDVRAALAAYDITAELSLPDVAQELAAGAFHAVVLHVSGSQDGRVLEEIHRSNHRVPVVVHHPQGTVDDIVYWTRRGAFHTLIGNLDSERLQHMILAAVQQGKSKLSAASDTAPWRRLLVGRSPAIQQVCEIIELVASKRCTVLISGETGTGKEMAARALHAASNRASLPMVAVNCAALPGNLIEAELFGHAKGAFTGAHASRIGRFEQAHRSSIFLDEIGDLPLEAQSKLLRVLQEQELQRIGSSETIKIDVRVITASNLNLEQAVRERRFREDLYYRLNVVPLHLPPLRERREDIPLLVEHFLEKIRIAENTPPKEITPEALESLMAQEWPGNVRQLEHAVQMACALSGERRTLHAYDFELGKRTAQVVSHRVQSSAKPFLVMPKEGIDFDAVVSSFELSLLNQALAAAGGNKARAADLLGIKRTTLLAKMKTLSERDPQRKAAASTTKRPATPAHPSALIVESDPAIRSLIVRTLQSQRYRVLQATTPASAIEMLDCWRTWLSLVIAPGDTIDPADPLFRCLQREAERVPTLFLLSEPKEHELTNTRGTATLLRPFSSEELLAAIDQLIEPACEAVSFCA
jgi:DNA-binding NtrC family response regulator